MEMSNVSSISTGTKAIDCLISRVKVSDFSDKHGAYFIGEFKGTLPYNMARDLYRMKNERGVLWKLDNGKYTIVASISHGQYKSTFCKVTFSISIIENEDLCPDED
jgi:hypothetical protein